MNKTVTTTQNVITNGFIFMFSSGWQQAGIVILNYNSFRITYDITWIGLLSDSRELSFDFLCIPPIVRIQECYELALGAVYAGISCSGWTTVLLQTKVFYSRVDEVLYNCSRIIC